MGTTAKRSTETTEFAAMLRRMTRAYGRRIADGDPADLAEAVRIAGELEQAIGEAVAGMREVHGFSWAELGRELGVTRQAAQQRFGRYCAKATA